MKVFRWIHNNGITACILMLIGLLLLYSAGGSLLYLFKGAFGL